MESEAWKVVVHREVTKKHLPLLEAIGLKGDYEDILSILKHNPFERVRNFEKLEPKNKSIFSMRLNNQHRVIYTIDKQSKTVKVYAAWSHYENNMPKM